MSKRKAKLLIDGKTLEFDVQDASLGHAVLDVSPLIDQGYFAFDSGFSSTASCQSSISYVDGEKGILLYRGYPIEELAQKKSYLEIAYLLYHAHLPQKDDLKLFQKKIALQQETPKFISEWSQTFSKKAHPMAFLSSAYAHFASEDSCLYQKEEEREEIFHKTLGITPILVAMAYRHSVGEECPKVEKDLSYEENFLHLMFSPKGEVKRFSSSVVRAFGIILSLHADHEQNASTSVMRMVLSTGAKPFAAFSSAVMALWGPLHGGANEAVLSMLKEIGSIDNIEAYLDLVKEKKEVRLMGFGHRVYKTFDPRAVILKSILHEVLDEFQKKDNHLLKIAVSLEARARTDPYFINHQLYPNVDFYSGIILESMGIPSSFFVSLFALARAAGWSAHWNEFAVSKQRICRPRQHYIGSPKRDLPTHEAK